MDLSALQEDKENGNAMSISWSDYEEVDSVYLMVKKIDPALDTFSFTMKFTSEKNAPMSVAGKFFLGLFIWGTKGSEADFGKRKKMVDNK